MFFYLLFVPENVKTLGPVFVTHYRLSMAENVFPNLFI